MWKASAATGVVSVPFSGFRPHLTPALAPHQEAERWACRPFLPNFFVDTPLTRDHPAISHVVGAVNAYFSTKSEMSSVDSL